MAFQPDTAKTARLIFVTHHLISYFPGEPLLFRLPVSLQKMNSEPQSRDVLETPAVFVGRELNYRSKNNYFTWFFVQHLKPCEQDYLGLQSAFLSLTQQKRYWFLKLKVIFLVFRWHCPCSQRELYHTRGWRIKYKLFCDRRGSYRLVYIQRKEDN